MCTEIEKIFNDVGKDLKDYPTLPFPDDSVMQQLENRLIMEELDYDRFQMRAEHEKQFQNLNEQQLNAYNAILYSVCNSKGEFFFLSMEVEVVVKHFSGTLYVVNYTVLAGLCFLLLLPVL